MPPSRCCRRIHRFSGSAHRPCPRTLRSSSADRCAQRWPGRRTRSRSPGPLLRAPPRSTRRSVARDDGGCRRESSRALGGKLDPRPDDDIDGRAFRGVDRERLARPTRRAGRDHVMSRVHGERARGIDGRERRVVVQPNLRPGRRLRREANGHVGHAGRDRFALLGDVRLAWIRSRMREGQRIVPARERVRAIRPAPCSQSARLMRVPTFGSSRWLSAKRAHAAGYWWSRSARRPCWKSSAAAAAASPPATCARAVSATVRPASPVTSRHTGPSLMVGIGSHGGRGRNCAM